MNYKEALEFLYKLEGRAYNMDLWAIARLLGKLGNPQKNLKVVHVAGTNGKGSVCAMLSSILSKAGCKVGMYTSPHLINFNERVQINSKAITNDEFLKYFNHVIKFYSDETFFEFVTALAFLYFFDKKVDYLVLEVGLGGRLDATNVITPLVSVITNIGLEHQEYLGDDIDKIAYEKAGIIKPDVPVVTAASGSALKVIEKLCKEKNSDLFVVKKDGKRDGKELKLSLKGEFQIENALVAVKVASILKIDKDFVEKGLLDVEWPGRFEFISKNYLVDCAHNIDAVKVLVKELVKIRKSFDRIILVVGILKDKDYSAMLKELNSAVDEVIITKPVISRAALPSELIKYVEGAEIIEDVTKAVEYARKKASSNDLVLVTGSIYTVGEALGRK